MRLVFKKRKKKITTPYGKWTSKVSLFKKSIENSIHAGGKMEVLLQSFKNADQFFVDFSQWVIYLPTNLFKRDIL